MLRAIAIVILVVAVPVTPHPQSYQHQHRVFMAQTSSDNSKPVQTGFVFRQMNNNPATFEAFGREHSAPLGDGFVQRYSDIASHEASPETVDTELSGPSMAEFHGVSLLNTKLPLPDLKMSFDHSAFLTATESSMPYTTKSWTAQSIDYEIAKAKSKYNSDPLLSVKAKSDQIKNKMQPFTRYTRPLNTLEDMVPKYDFSREFHIDDDDVKTSSRNAYEWWPYFSHSPYEYEHLKMDSDIQKAKEKRYAIDSSDRVIPVHESHDDYSSVYHPVDEPRTVPHYQRTKPTDNPIKADEPFFSFVLNDYYDKNKDDDSLTFKGLEWGTDFDTDNYNYNPQKDYAKRHSDFSENNNANNYDGASKEIGKSVTERGYDKTHSYDKHENGESHKENHKSDRSHSGDNEAHYKNFVDQFANKFGGEDHKRHSNFALKTNKENGEKRKGFRRVYHKDEYQEDNEFFDNTGNSAKSEDSGSSTAHIGGSEAAVQSHAAAALGNEANGFKNVGNVENNKFINKHDGKDAKHGVDRDFNKYIDIGKRTAHSK